jgi:coniferyl-aldehyde dehydrogenase
MDNDAQPVSAQQAYDRLRSRFNEVGPLSIRDRRKALRALEKALVARKAEISAAISADFNGRAPGETFISEIFGAHAAARHARRHVKEWAQPEAVELPWFYKPARSRMEYQPLGVVGIISPWNYPLLLAVSPIAGAIAAGNRILLKPSELTPQTSALLARVLPEVLGDDVIAVVTGGAEVGDAFSRLPLDHLLFTGSTAVGRKVMAAASDRLTPVTLELGGKSPALVHESFSLSTAATRIAMGKLFNSGQTCIAPDYVLCPEDKVADFVSAYQAAVKKLYPTIVANEEYTSIINDRHRGRLQGLLSQAVQAGATATEVNPAGEDFSVSPKMAPVILTGLSEDAEILKEEIFGPLLPVVAYKTLPDAIKYINARPRPLALYYFDRRRSRIRQVMSETVSGGVTVNHTLVHAALDVLPFGGVGESGMGSYHGFHGFETFSHRKSIIEASRMNLLPVLMRPRLYRMTRAVLRLMML